MTKKKTSIICFFGIILIIIGFFIFKKYPHVSKKYDSKMNNVQNFTHRDKIYSVFTKVYDASDTIDLNNIELIQKDLNDYLMKRDELLKMFLMPDLKNKKHTDLVKSFIAKTLELDKNKLDDLSTSELDYFFVKTFPFDDLLFPSEKLSFIPNGLVKKLDSLYKEKRMGYFLEMQNQSKISDIEKNSDYFQHQVREYLNNFKFYKKIRLISIVNKEFNEMDQEYIDEKRSAKPDENNLLYQEKDYFLFYINEQSKDFVLNFLNKKNRSIDEMLSFYKKNKLKYIKKTKESYNNIIDQNILTAFADTYVKSFSGIFKDLSDAELIMYVDNVYINKNLGIKNEFLELKRKNAKKIYDFTKKHIPFSRLSKNNDLHYDVIEIFCDKFNQCVSNSDVVQKYTSINDFSKDNLNIGYSKIILDEEKENFFAYEIDEVSFYQNIDSFYRSNKKYIDSKIYESESKKIKEGLVNNITAHINDSKYDNFAQLLNDVKKKFNLSFKVSTFELDLYSSNKSEIKEDCINAAFYIKNQLNANKCDLNIMVLNEVKHEDSLYDLNKKKNHITHSYDSFLKDILTSYHNDLSLKYQNKLSS